MGRAPKYKRSSRALKLTLTVPNPPIWIRFCSHSRGWGLTSSDQYTNARVGPIMFRCNPRSVKKIAANYTKDVTKDTKKYQVLRDLDLFVLDNSIRESTVGQLRGHTLENKWQLYEEVKRCGFKNIIVAAFSHMTRVDDVFIKQMVDRGEDRSGLYAFSEITAGRSWYA